MAKKLERTITQTRSHIQSVAIGLLAVLGSAGSTWVTLQGTVERNQAAIHEHEELQIHPGAATRLERIELTQEVIKTTLSKIAATIVEMQAQELARARAERDALAREMMRPDPGRLRALEQRVFGTPQEVKK